jgi:signal transduction histidine kinase
VIITSVFDASGKLIGFGKVTRDLTERMHSEAGRVELARMQEADKRNQEVLAIMGHELRNPLAPMVTALRLVRLRGGQATEKELGIMDRQLGYMSRLVDDLLDASRSMQGKMRLNMRFIALSGYPRDLLREQEVPLGFAAHLHKPVDLLQLEAFLAG